MSITGVVAVIGMKEPVVTISKNIPAMAMLRPPSRSNIRPVTVHQSNNDGPRQQGQPDANGVSPRIVCKYNGKINVNPFMDINDTATSAAESVNSR